MNSVQEGASKGVPMVMIPLFADQHRNSKMLEYRKMAVVLNRKQLTVETLTESLKKIIDDDTYRKNAKRISALISAKPMAAEERVVKYTEFAAKFGPDLNLDMEGRHLNFLEFYCLDIIIPAILLIAVVLYFVYRVLRFILGKVLLFIFSENRLKFE
jgi:glucuronosyltransferase